MAGRRAGRALVAALANGGDVEELIKRYPLVPVILRSQSGRAAIRTRKMVARVRAELLAARFAPHAMSRLIKLMGEEKAEIGLKAALAVLQAGERRKAGARKTEGKPEEGAEGLDGAGGVETERLMRAMARVLREGEGKRTEQ